MIQLFGEGIQDVAQATLDHEAQPKLVQLFSSLVSHAKHVTDNILDSEPPFPTESLVC